MCFFQQSAHFIADVNDLQVFIKTYFRHLFIIMVLCCVLLCDLQKLMLCNSELCFYEKLEINNSFFPVNMIWDVGWFNTNTYLLKEDPFKEMSH